MGVKISLENTTELDDGIWRSTLDRSELPAFGSSISRKGLVSIILLDNNPEFHQDKKILQFKLSDVHILNMGSSSDVVFIKDSNPKIIQTIEDDQAIPSKSGDNVFLDKLPDELNELGTNLLKEIRVWFAGNLIFHKTSGKFVESVNFWTVRIQPRDLSLRITVYGLPDSFEVDDKSIELKKDMSSYSAFKISKIDQVAEAVSIIKQAFKKKERKNPY